ncbi:PACE efflux transporter [Psychrobacter ciconiae]|uniref:PACE efflux transporter n=1 Tax=Psychrobacter ciconiae TaxID=1553449 RepID=UPI001D1075E8|nr:PACE efflux transporter [Psychrobacter ciconiae]
MITLSPLKRRIVYVTIFEILAILLSTLILMWLSGGDAQDSFPVAVMVSVTAVVWNFIYNTGFENLERRLKITERTIMVRSVHAIVFESGLLLFCIPIYMLWYKVGIWQAFVMEAALLLFFLVYTFVFTLIFDKIFTLPYQQASSDAQTCSS